MMPSKRISRFARDEDGATLVELAIVLPVYLLLFFGLIDFCRIGFSYVMAGKATERAVRLAVVRPPLCPDVPTVNLRGTNASGDIPFGAACNLDQNVCQTVAMQSCSFDSQNAVAGAIWTEVQPLMPTNATPQNLLIRYEHSPDMGFLGGPYTPVVTVEIQNLNFEFVTPLGALIALAGATGFQSVGTDYAFPSMSSSLPAEALFDGDTT